MKKWLIPLLIIAVIAFGLYQWAVGFNNNAIRFKEATTEAWGKVESSYQRRNDLIGNLVKTVQGAADFERGTLKDVIEARAKASSTTIDPTGWFNFDELAYFKSDPGSEDAPDVDFDFSN